MFKHKIKPVDENKKHMEEKPHSEYIRDFYLKDFKYISPEGVGVNKNNRARNYDKNLNREGICRLFTKLWLVEVMKGLKQFLYEGSLHGVKYVFEPTFSRKERFTWVVIVVISIAFCAVNITQLFCKWTSTPFVNVIDSLPTPIWAIPFPSVVLCPHLHVKMSYANVSQLNNLEHFYAGLVCPQMKNQKITLERRMTEEETKMMQEFIIQGSPTCKEVVRACTWRPRHGSDWSTEDCCEKLFKPIFTNYGLCFTFNSLPLNGFTNASLAWQKSFNPDAEFKALEWNLDVGYPKVFPINSDMVPWRIKGAGETNGLGLELYLNSSEHQFGCDGNNVGFTIVIRSPIDHVYTSTVIRLPMNRMTSIEIDPTTYKTDASLRALEPNMRQCYFQSEKKLRHFIFYTGSNCKLDILIQEARTTCKCVLYNWPRKIGYDSICSTRSDYNCIRKIRDNLAEQFMYAYYVDSDEERRREYRTTTRFSCYPSCNDIFYNNQVFYSNLVARVEHNASIDYNKGFSIGSEFTYRIYKGIATHCCKFLHTGRTLLNGFSKFSRKSKKEITQMNVHFQQDMFLGQHRHAQYDDYYFAGAIGGLLSLFLGFSIISVAELVYFVILKPVRTAFSEVYCHKQ